MRLTISLFVLAAIAAAIAGSPAPLKFADVKPIFDTKCVSCHSSKRAFGKLDLSSRTAALKGGEKGKVIKPKNAAGSLLIKMVKGTAKPKMPKSGPPLSAAEIKKLYDWIQAGAK